MQVAKITIWDGSYYYTNQFDTQSLKRFFDNARNKFLKEGRVVKENAEVEIIEMSEQEYINIPATNESEELFDRAQ
jgi:hypothetical protein